MADTRTAAKARGGLAPSGDVDLCGRPKEAFRRLWGTLFYSGRAAGKTVMVCSAERSDAAPRTACGLATAGSELGGAARVALLDLDLRSPRIHRLLHAARLPGVAEVVTGACSLVAAARYVRPGLDVFPAGDVAGREEQILVSDRLATFVADVSAEYDYVLATAARVTHYPDAQILAGLLRQVLIVSDPAEEARRAAGKARKLLERAGGRSAGVVICSSPAPQEPTDTDG